MARIIEKILEPSKIDAGSIFKIKVRVEDVLTSKKIFVTEDAIKIITEDGNIIRTEWGD